MPSWELFAAQDDAYRDAVLPPGLPAVAVEAGVSQGWERWVDRVVAIDRFGASAPGAAGPREARDHGGEHRARRARAPGRADGVVAGAVVLLGRAPAVELAALRGEGFDGGDGREHGFMVARLRHQCK